MIGRCPGATVRHAGRQKCPRNKCSQFLARQAAHYTGTRDGLHQIAEMYRRGLAFLDDNQSLFIARGEAEHIGSTGVRVGAYLPLYCSATGRVLLGGRSDGEIRQLRSY